MEQQSSNSQYSNNYYVGVDSGASTTNVVIINGDGKIVGMATAVTGAKIDSSAMAALAAAMKQCKIGRPQINYIIATGYGRNALRWPDQDINEIVCQAKGAYEQFPEARTVIDMGGQDSAIIQMDEQGNVYDFLMNDQCASGSGRFLEMMSKTLGLKIEDFTKAGLQWDEDVTISSTCAVFAENEVVNLIAQQKRVADIIHGLNGAIVNRIVNMIARQGADGKYIMTGGVAKNDGILNELAARLNDNVLRPKFPEMNGAYGAALLAKETKQRSS